MKPKDTQRERVCHQCFKSYEPSICPVCQERKVNQMLKGLRKEAARVAWEAVSGPLYAHGVPFKIRMNVKSTILSKLMGEHEEK